MLAGLWRARRDGVGCDCDISLLDTALHELGYFGTWAASRGYVPPRRSLSAHAVIVPFQNFPTADGWIVVACPKEKFWRQLCDAIERPELAEEFPTFADRDRRRDELEPILEEVFRARTSEEWLAVLATAGVPSAPVNDLEAALEEARIVEYEHAQLGTVRQVASPLRLSGAEPPLRAAPGGVDVGAARRHQPAGRNVDENAGRPVVVVEEVGPEQGAAGEAAGAAGARELLAERPSGGCRKRGLGPQRRGRHPFGHPIDDHELRRRRRRRRCDRLQHRVGDPEPDADRQERQVDQ